MAFPMSTDSPQRASPTSQEQEDCLDQQGSHRRRGQVMTLPSVFQGVVVTVIVVVLLIDTYTASTRGSSWWPSHEKDESFMELFSRFLQTNDTHNSTTSMTHEPLFPLSSRDVWGFVFAICGLILAAGGGIGGGGILVPIYIFVLGFTPKHAIPLSNVTVFGGAVANTLLNSRKRHPLADRPLIDWDLILVMEPLTIAGALLGTSLNKLLPQLVIVVMLVVLLSATAYKTLGKAYKLYQKENSKVQWSKVETEEDIDNEEDTTDIEMTIVLTDDESSQDENTHQDKVPPPKEDCEEVQVSHLDSPSSVLHGPAIRLSDDEKEHLNLHLQEPHLLHKSASSPSVRTLFALGVNDDSTSPLKSSLATHDDLPSLPLTDDPSEQEQPSKLPLTVESGGTLTNPLLQHILEEERYTPIRNVITIVALFLVVLNINIIKGGGAFSSPIGIECGSLSFWLAEAFMLTCIMIVSVAARTLLLRRTRTKSTVEYPYVEGDIMWTAKNTILYPMISCIAGFVAGLFGIGGGIVKGPLMLQMGVHPAVASATSACMIFFTSFTATTSFVVFGLLVSDYAIALLLVGFFATLVGQTVMSMLLQRYKRNSYIAFSIGIVVVLSAILLTTESLLSHDEETSTSTSGVGSGGLCSSRMGE